MVPCKVDDCDRPAVTKEIYLKPGGHGKFADAVCSYHTGRWDRLTMIGKEPIVGEAEYKVSKE